MVIVDKKAFFLFFFPSVVLSRFRFKIYIYIYRLPANCYGTNLRLVGDTIFLFFLFSFPARLRPASGSGRSP